MWHTKTTSLPFASNTESRGKLSLNARRRFEGFQLNVQVHIPLSFTALLGVSGAGKSLTLRSLAGLLHPDEGRIALDGRVLFDSQQHIFLPPQARRIGYVPQHSALFPHQTVAEQIRFALPARGNRKSQAARVAELITVLELEGLERRYPDALSGGQQRRVALARALAADPQLLVLDEPFSALDVPVRERLYELLCHLHRQFALPVILVTHDRAEVEQLADTVVVLHQGSVVQVGSVQEVFLAPRTPDVARLVGQDNLFGGELAVPPSTPEGAPASAIRLTWVQHAKAGLNAPDLVREGECAWLPLPSNQRVPESRQVSGCIYADEISVTRWTGEDDPPRWTPEGAVLWLATLLHVQRLGTSIRLHFHPHQEPASHMIEVCLNAQQWREVAGATGETFLLKIAPNALHCFP
ncbi:MAG TPA: ATP-binding cassette domain-containing protein [Ktedonobacteraceae bacterium]